MWLWRKLFGLNKLLLAKIVIHTNLTNEEVSDLRLKKNFKLSYQERMRKAFELMKLSILFSKKDKIIFKKGIRINGRFI